MLRIWSEIEAQKHTPHIRFRFSQQVQIVLCLMIMAPTPTALLEVDQWFQWQYTYTCAYTVMFNRPFGTRPTPCGAAQGTLEDNIITQFAVSHPRPWGIFLTTHSPKLRKPAPSLTTALSKPERMSFIHLHIPPLPLFWV